MLIVETKSYARLLVGPNTFLQRGIVQQPLLFEKRAQPFVYRRTELRRVGVCSIPQVTKIIPIKIPSKEGIFTPSTSSPRHTTMAGL